MERTELVELLYSAAERSRTVRATVTRWTDERRLREPLRARGAWREPPAIPAEEGTFGEPPDRVESTTRIWRAQPDLVRWEKQVWAGGTTSREVVVNRGTQQWVNSDIGGARSNEDSPLSWMSAPEERLLDPAPLLGSFRVEALGDGSLRARPGVLVRAAVRAGERSNGFAPWVDRLDLLVDRERGVLLRMSELVDGQEVSRSEIVELAFDEPLAADLFRPPA